MCYFSLKIFPYRENSSQMSASHTPVGETFPFERYDHGGAPGLLAALESDALFPRYYHFFEEMGMKGMVRAGKGTSRKS